MTHIKFEISNPNNNDYKEIVLRKFFNMIFVSPDGKTLRIYTATVFGGSTEEVGKDNLCCKYHSGAGCSLKFTYSSVGNDVRNYKFNDLTASLWKQTDCIAQVWGECESLTSQKQVSDKLNYVYENVDSKESLNIDAGWPLYYFHEKKANHDCIVTHGEFEAYGQENNSASYTIKQDSEAKHDGIELMNWILSEITLSESILNKTVAFEIILNGENGCQYYTPDFTWYFAPPEGYIVDGDKATVWLQETSLRNVVLPLADDTTIKFEEWTRQERIGERQKSRVYISQQTAENNKVISDNNGIKVKLRFHNPHKYANRQFVIGLLIAFILSFCADKTRLNDYLSCIKQMCQCKVDHCYCGSLVNSLSFLFPLLAVMTYISLIFNITRCVTKDNKAIFAIWFAIKGAGVFCSIGVMLYTFFIWPVFPNMISNLVKTCNANTIIIVILSAIGLVFNLAYILYCIWHKKKKILDYI